MGSRWATATLAVLTLGACSHAQHPAARAPTTTTIRTVDAAQLRTALRFAHYPDYPVAAIAAERDGSVFCEVTHGRAAWCSNPKNTIGAAGARVLGGIAHFYVKVTADGASRVVHSSPPCENWRPPESH